MGTVTSQGGESGWSLATGFCISHFRGRGERRSVPRCLWYFGARAVFETEEHDGALPADNGRLANAD